MSAEYLNVWKMKWQSRGEHVWLNERLNDTNFFFSTVALAIASKTPAEIKALLVSKYKNRGSVTKIADKLGNPGATVAEWLILTPKDKMPKPEVMMFPKPPKAPDGSLIYERIPNKMDVTERVPINAQQPPSLKKRHYEEINGIDSKCKKLKFQS